MKAKSMMLALAAGGVCTAGALAAEPNLSNEFESGRVQGHIYVNAVTGEVVRTPAASRLTTLYWENDDIAGSCNFFTGVDRPTRDTAATGRVKFGASVVTWGDTPCCVTNGYDAAYASNVGSDTLGSGITGFNMINIFIDSYDGAIDPGGTGASGIVGFILADIAGGDVTLGTSLFAGWIYTVDLEGGFEFAWGDGSGSCPDDLDGDGLHDMSYAYTFEQTQAPVAKGICGPFLVRPFSLGGAGTATGCVDAYDWFNDAPTPAGGPYGTELTDYVGAFFFGGGLCPSVPYAVFLMNLYGECGSPCSAIDYNGDGLIDFGDYLGFLNAYDSQDASADLNGDGLVDFGDYLEFLNLYDACQ